MLDTLGVSVLRRWASVAPERKELPGGGSRMVSETVPGSVATCFGAGAAGAGGAGAGFAAGEGEVAGKRATASSRLQEAKIDRARARLVPVATKFMRDMV
jgi:hypothetical protein